MANPSPLDRPLERPTASGEADPSQLLDQVLARTLAGKRIAVVDAALQQRIDKLEELLPRYLRGEGARLAKRAVLTMVRTPKLQECTAESFVRCVLEAAELGLAIDGRLAHAVPFNNKVKGSDGVERWRLECQFIPDYKGLIAVARRGGILRDIYADVVCQNDHFVAERQLNSDLLIHKRDLTRPRGNLYAAYAVVVRPDGSSRFELMDLEELYAIRARSKAFTAAKTGPWVSDLKEMCRKTVVRRTLKMYADDGALKRSLERDDVFELDSSGGTVPTPGRPAPAGQPVNGNEHDGEPPSQVDMGADDYEREPGEEG
jgi:recombination protein RecT